MKFLCWYIYAYLAIPQNCVFKGTDWKFRVKDGKSWRCYPVLDQNKINKKLCLYDISFYADKFSI